MNNQEKFKELFLEFEDETKKKLNYKYDKLEICIDELRNKGYNPYVREYSFITFCRRLRNITFHNLNDNYYLITNETIEKFSNLLYEVKHPFKVYDKSSKNVYSKTINDYVLKTMKDMNEKNYTHIPIYDENSKTIVGIFSENTIFQYILEDNKIQIDDNTKFKDITKCIDIKKSKEIVKFVSRDKLYDDVVNDFIREFKDGNKLSCIMITTRGTIDEKVIGVLTSWDIIGR